MSSNFPTFSARQTGTAWPLGVANTMPMPELVTPEQDLTPELLQSAIKSVQPGDFLLDERFLPGISPLTVFAELNQVEELEKTREASGRELWFGQLIMRADDDGEHTLQVAVKPFFQNELAEAAHEYGVASYFAGGKVPNVATYTPFGIYRYQDGKRAVISHYRHPVRSLDTVLWNPDAIAQPLLVQKALGRVATSLSALHKNGWTHGDAQAKNFAWDVTRPPRSTFAIDVESFKPFGPDADRASVKETIIVDADKFIGSAFRLKDMGVELPADYSDWVKQYFCGTYVSGMINRPGKHIPTYDELASLVDRAAGL